MELFDVLHAIETGVYIFVLVLFILITGGWLLGKRLGWFDKSADWVKEGISTGKTWARMIAAVLVVLVYAAISAVIAVVVGIKTGIDESSELLTVNNSGQIVALSNKDIEKLEKELSKLKKELEKEESSQTETEPSEKSEELKVKIMQIENELQVR